MPPPKVKRVRSLWRDRNGMAALEYALLGSLIAVSVGFAAPRLGLTLQNMFTNIEQTVP